MHHLILIILVVAYLPFLSIAQPICNNVSLFSQSEPIFSCGKVGDNTTFLYEADFICDGNSVSALSYEFTVDWGDDVSETVNKNMSNGEEIMIYHVYNQAGQYFPFYNLSVYDASGFFGGFSNTPMTINVTADDCEVSNPSNEKKMQCQLTLTR